MTKMHARKKHSRSRRRFIQATTTSLSAYLLSGCEKAISKLSLALGQQIPPSTRVASTSEIDPDFHLLSRATYGVAPGDLEEVQRLGKAKWIERQLSPESINNDLCELRTRRFESVQLTPDNCYEYERRTLREELQRYTLLNAIYSKKQLFEVMVEFWSDHLNISVDKSQSIYFKPSDDREVIRKHALGNFRDLIRASATSGAMLEYLDGRKNLVAEGSSEKPNENYARELLELYTLGVSGGYKQQDVLEASKSLTGWHSYRKLFLWNKRSLRVGKVEFKPKLHVKGDKEVLGRTIRGDDGIDELEQLMDIVCHHPSTARNISHKLCQRFVSYKPPRSLTQRVEKIFLETGGDIKPLLREILNSDEFAQSSGQLFKRPLRFVVSSIRATGGDTHAQQPLLKIVRDMGQMPFEWPTPDGYPFEKELWMGGMTKRWDYARRLANNQNTAIEVDTLRLGKSFEHAEKLSTVESVFAHFIGRKPDEKELQIAKNYLHASDRTGQSAIKDLIGLIIASPAFQYF